MIPLPNLSFADASNTASTSGTGAKYFGTALAAQSVSNPNRTDNSVKIAAIIAVVAVLGLFIYFKKGK